MTTYRTCTDCSIHSCACTHTNIHNDCIITCMQRQSRQHAYMNMSLHRSEASTCIHEHEFT